MVTGSKPLSVSIFRSEYHLRADNAQDESVNGLHCHVNICRSGIQVLKVNKELKAVSFRSYLIPHSTSDDVWNEHLSNTFNSAEFSVDLEGLNCSYTLSSSQVLLIPSALHARSKTEQNYSFIFGTTDHRHLSEQQLSNTDMVGIHAVPTGLDQLVERPIGSSFLHLVNQLHSESPKNRAHLIVDGKDFSIILFKDSKLVFSNWFLFDTAEDVLYYLMATLETLDILHTEIEVELSGQIDKGDEAHSVLSKYLPRISFRKRPRNLSYGYSFNEMPEHRYPFIFATACE